MEIFKIPEFEGYYIDKLGSIWSKRKRGRGTFTEENSGKELKKYLKKSGYLMVRLMRNKKIYDLSVHRLVASTFLTNKEGYPCVCHKNNIRTDNRVENLYWNTHKGNSQDMIDSGNSQRGEKNKRAKLKSTDIPLIWECIKNGIKQKDIASKFRVSFFTISKIKTGVNWKHLTCQY